MTDYPFYCRDCGSYDRRNWHKGGCRYFDDKPGRRAQGWDPPCALDEMDADADARRQRSRLWWICGAVAVVAVVLLAFTRPAKADECPIKFQRAEQILNSESVLEINDPIRAQAYIDFTEETWGINPIAYPGDRESISDFIIHKRGVLSVVTVYDAEGCETWSAIQAPGIVMSIMKVISGEES